MRIRFIAVSYEHRTELEVFLGSLLLQTCPDWTCDVWYDGLIPKDILGIMNRYSVDERIIFHHTEKRNGEYGHISRRIGLEEMQGDVNEDFVIHTNTDNYYTPGFVEQMLSAAKSRGNAGLVFSDTVHSHLGWAYHKSEVREGGLDCGCCMVRLDIAKRIGFRWIHFSADGRFLSECGGLAARIGLCAIHIAKPLFVHN